MFGSEILDVVIGMIFIFLLLSLVCSAVNEIIEAWLNRRADFLEKGIKELLNDKNGTGLVKELYNHPLVSGLFRGKYVGSREDKTLLPSYIPARNFALALMDVVLPGAENPQSGAESATTQPDNSKSGAEGATTPPHIPNSLQPLRAAISNNPIINDEVKKALITLVDAAGNDAAKARENIENWFNSSMDRVSGWYKRRSQIIILFLGLLIAGLLNADSITIANTLSYDKAMRDSLVATATEYAKNETAPPAAPASPVAAAGGVTSTSTPTPPAAASETVVQNCEKAKSKAGICSDACLKNTNSPECRLEMNLDKIKSLGLPIGWDRSNPKLVPPSNDIGAWLLKIFGWLITAFAISLGAPFWFDLLNKFMVVRSTVKPREKSPEEPSKA